MHDEGCPTCGSNDYGTVEIRKNSDELIHKNQCYHCKKFWSS